MQAPRQHLLPSLALAALAVASSCAINPATGERQLALISEAQEVQMGREASGQVRQTIGLVPDEALQAYVSQVGTGLAQGSERPDLPWQFAVVDDATPNAFALPGGFIYVTRGMVNLMSSEAELAAVLGHEIGHVTARHSVAQLSRAQLAQLGLGIGMILSPELQSLADLAGTGLSLLFLKYGRDDEREADELGFRYMLRGGYDIRKMSDVFVALQQSSELSGRSPLPTWLASHPGEAERIESARARAEALTEPQQEPRVGREEYLEHLDGLIYGENPRNGFFRGDHFYHPELLFQLAVPETWQRQNLPSAVLARSPENDAALELTLLGAITPEEAARRFLNQEGLAPGQSTRTEVNGNPAVVSQFRAQAQSGIVQGYVSHIAHQGVTYQLVTYAAAPVWPQYQALFEDIVRSFAPLTDESILSIEPRRIEIVRIEERMSLAEFARRHPSSVPLEELALLNHISDPDAPIDQGTALKRVVGEAVG